MQIQEVQITKLEANAGKELSNNFFRVCTFCDKIVRVNTDNFQSCIRLGGNKFYCPFCIRNNFHHRSNRNVLIVSYRAILGYYYQKLYDQNPRKLCFSQLEQCIEQHALIGLQNPVFSYDPYTFLWFVNFNNIGVDNRKAPIKEVQNIITQMYSVFNIEKHVNKNASVAMLEKFEKALVVFYKNRKRPKDRRMLIPTFFGMIKESEEFFEETRNFVKKSLILK